MYCSQPVDLFQGKQANHGCRRHCDHRVSVRSPCQSPQLTARRAGIIGLDTALVLSEQGYGKHISVVAEHLPGDTSVTYTSPW
jgi:hypothetical protein